MLAFELIVSKKDSDDKGDMVKEGLKTKALKGLPNGVASLGFLNDKTGEIGNRKWMLDKTRLKSIKILFEMFLTGRYSAGKLHRYAVEELKLTTVKRKRIGGEPICSSLSRVSGAENLFTLHYLHTVPICRRRVFTVFQAALDHHLRIIIVM